MSKIAFDTLKFAKTLKNAGVPEVQAEAQAEAFAEIFTVTMKDLVTKQDLNRRFELLEQKLDLVLERLERKIDLLVERANR